VTVAEYMALRCLCGATRAEHVHAHDLATDGTWNPTDDTLRVIGMNDRCRGFTWEMERELGGNPLVNKHLAPLMAPGD
jgi:hypothetical protein